MRLSHAAARKYALIMSMCLLAATDPVAANLHMYNTVHTYICTYDTPQKNVKYQHSSAGSFYHVWGRLNMETAKAILK